MWWTYPRVRTWSTASERQVMSVSPVQYASGDSRVRPDWFASAMAGIDSQ